MGGRTPAKPRLWRNDRKTVPSNGDSCRGDGGAASGTLLLVTFVAYITFWARGFQGSKVGVSARAWLLGKVSACCRGAQVAGVYLGGGVRRVVYKWRGGESMIYVYVYLHVGVCENTRSCIC